jgi:hypothetical protein
MDGIQPVDHLPSGRRILIEGNAAQITSMLDDVESRLNEKGFGRDPLAEQMMNRPPQQKTRALCFVGGPKGGPLLQLCLQRISDRRVRGSYSPVDGAHAGGPSEVASVVDDVIRNVIVPLANLFGLKVTRPRLGPKSQIQPRTMAALLAFSDVAAGERLPLSSASEAAWRKFLVTVGQEEVAFDMDELADWFVTNGWASEDARSLTERFVRDATLLAEYSEAIGS